MIFEQKESNECGFFLLHEEKRRKESFVSFFFLFLLHTKIIHCKILLLKGFCVKKRGFEGGEIREYHCKTGEQRGFPRLMGFCTPEGRCSSSQERGFCEGRRRCQMYYTNLLK